MCKLFLHMCREFLHMCKLFLHVCRGFLHMCKLFLHVCRGFLHMCKLFLHVCRGFLHMCKLFLHVCRGLAHWCGGPFSGCWGGGAGWGMGVIGGGRRIWGVFLFVWVKGYLRVDDENGEHGGAAAESSPHDRALTRASR